MSLDVYLTLEEEKEHTKTDGDGEVYQNNITHNLGRMADEAELYKFLWRPNEIGVTKAKQLIEPLKRGLTLLRSDPYKFKKFDAKNKWGIYENLVDFVADYLVACVRYPEATVEVSR